MSLYSKNTTITNVLSILMLLALLNSAYFFLAIIKFSFGQWLAFNACSLAMMIYLICFGLFQIKKLDYILAIPLLPLYYYGTMGLFVIPWNESNIFPQITHVIITINIVWLLYSFIKERKIESIGKGVLIATFCFVPMFAYIQSYVRLHLNELTQALQKI